MEFEDKNIITEYLVGALSQKGFNVSTNRYGIITKCEKMGIICCPQITDSSMYGKLNVSRLVNSVGYSSPRDLGYYYHERDNKDNNIYYKDSYSVEKYNHRNGVEINKDNYKDVINTFVSELNKDYMNIGKKAIKLNNSLKEELGDTVKIVNTNSVFDGKKGVIEQELNDEYVVFVEFDDKGHKVRNNFKKENVEFDNDISYNDNSEDSVMEEKLINESQESDILKSGESLETQISNLRGLGWCIDDSDWVAFAFRNGKLIGTDDIAKGLDDGVVIEKIDNPKIIALASYLDINPGVLEIGWEDYVIRNTDDESEYIVCPYWKAKDLAIEHTRELLDDVGIDGLGIDIDVTRYMDEDFFAEIQDESNRNYAEDIAYEDDSEYGNRLIAECVDYGLIDFPNDFELNSDVDTEDENFDPDDPSNYTCAVDESELVDRYVEYLNNDDDPCSWFIDNFGEGELSADYCQGGIDLDQLAEDLIDDYGVAQELASYDGDEIELGEYDGVDLYAYRIN